MRAATHSTARASVSWTCRWCGRSGSPTRTGIEARIESFNAFNWFQLNNPVNARDNPLFGQITSAGDPRIMQFALKYQF